MPMPKRIPKKSRAVYESEALPHSLRPDVDNLLKFALDGIVGIAIYDDGQIVRVIGEKYYSPNPRTEIDITSLSVDMKALEVVKLVE